MDQLWDRTGYGTLISTGAGDNYLHNPAGGILRDNDSWLHSDAVGSVRHVTDPAGAVTASSAFTVFGEPRDTGTSGFGFAGEQTDPNSLVHLRARAYNPGLGSFTSYDPLQPGGPSTAGWNHYSYAGNNPTTWTDPTGQAVMMEYAERMVQGMVMGMAIGLWACQDGDFDWKGPFGDNAINGDCVAGSILLGGLFGAFAPGTMLGVCVAGAADGAASHALNAYMEDADPTVAGAVRDGGIGCAIGLLTMGIASAIKRGRNAIGGDGPGPRGDGPGGGCKSFSGDTHVLMADGTTKPISEIELGDQVMAADPTTGEHRGQAVLAVFVHEDITVDFATSAGTITTTEDHSFYNATDRSWQESQFIDSGDQLYTTDGSDVAAIGLQWHTTVSQTAYNLDVANLDTYYVLAGDTPILVHNHDHDDVDGVPNESYENPGHHDPNGGDNPYNPKKSVLPGNAEELFNQSDQVGKNRWAIEGEGRDAVFHRFSNDGNGNWHWSGATEGERLNGQELNIPKEQVPNEVRKAARSGNGGGC